MGWKGRESFCKALAKAGYAADKTGMARLAEALGKVMVKPPTWASLKTVCLSPSGAGFKRRETIDALCVVLGCLESDLYEPPKKHISTWDRIREGVDVKERESWPL